MKITSELKAKIERQLTAKYQARNDANSKKLKDAKDAIIPVLVADLQKVYEENNLIRVILDKKSYNGFDAEALVRSHLEYMPCMEAVYTEWREENNAISLARSRDYEGLAIAISYQRDLNGIKEAFLNCGMEF